MEEKDFDIDTIIDELSDRIENIIEDTLSDQVESAVTCAVQDVFIEALGEGFSECEFVLKDGTVVRPSPKMKVFSPDKSKLLVCYGGLRVDGCSLIVQTRINCWETIAWYKSREEAIEALIKVKNAMESGVTVFEL